MKTVGGWWRLWIVMTGIFCVVAITAATQKLDYAEPYKGTNIPSPSACVPITKESSEAPWSIYAREAYDRDEASEIVDVEGQLVEVRPGDPRYRTPSQRGIRKPIAEFEVHCTSWIGLLKNLAVALLYSALIALAGLALRWIYRGFKKNEK